MYIRLWEKFKAWRRGETMSKGVNRGRVFTRKQVDTADSSAIVVKAKPAAKLVKIRVIRADGTIEEKEIDNG